MFRFYVLLLRLYTCCIVVVVVTRAFVGFLSGRSVFFECFLFLYVIIIIYIEFVVWFIKIVYNLLLVAVAVVVVVLGILVYGCCCCNIICYWVAFVVVINPWRFP